MLRIRSNISSARATRVAALLLVSAGTSALIIGCSSDTGNLSVGDCVNVEGFTIGGDVEDVSCDEVRIGTNNYRVEAVGSESEMDAECDPSNLVIVDGDDAACLSQ